MELLRTFFFAIIFAGSAINPAGAHEFWIEGTVLPFVKPSAVSLDLKVGQNLKGQSLPFIPAHIVSFRQLDGERQVITGQIGSIPAATLSFDADNGFAAFVEMKPRFVEHTDWKAFLQYLDMEGLVGIEARHIARGLPLSGFTESYARHAKVLFLGRNFGTQLPGHRAGAPIEIEITSVEETNGHEVLLRGALLIGGEPESGRQVTVFERIGGTVRTYSVRTDQLGKFQVSVSKDAELLFNSVLLTEGKRADVAWHSDWASLSVYLRQDPFVPAN